MFLKIYDAVEFYQSGGCVDEANDYQDLYKMVQRTLQ